MSETDSHSPAFWELTTVKANATSTTRHHLDPDNWVENHGDSLYRYALLRLRNKQLAEDMVQETFLAALHSRDKFSGDSSEKAWLLGILKHKVVDEFRKGKREKATDDMQEMDKFMEEVFDDRGRWKVGPSKWTTHPDAVFDQKEFWGVLKNCLQMLPNSISDAFILREMEGLDGKEVCALLEITENNLWIMLYRARMRLRHCLETHWLKSSDQGNRKG